MREHATGPLSFLAKAFSHVPGEPWIHRAFIPRAQASALCGRTEQTTVKFHSCKEATVRTSTPAFLTRSARNCSAFFSRDVTEDQG